MSFVTSTPWWGVFGGCIFAPCISLDVSVHYREVMQSRAYQVPGGGGMDLWSPVRATAAHQPSLCKAARGGSGVASGWCQVLAWALLVAIPPAELPGAAFELCLSELSTGPT